MRLFSFFIIFGFPRKSAENIKLSFKSSSFDIKNGYCRHYNQIKYIEVVMHPRKNKKTAEKDGSSCQQELICGLDLVSRQKTKLFG